jgi:hypothetical protein
MIKLCPFQSFSSYRIKKAAFGWAARIVDFLYPGDRSLFSPDPNLLRDLTNRKSALNKDENQNKS